MAFRLPLLTLLAAVYLCLGLCAARSVPMRRDLHSPISLPSLDEALHTVDVWKRRIHHSSDAGSDSGSDSSSTDTSSSSSSSNKDDDDADDKGSSSASTKNRCVTRVIYNKNGYGSYYSDGKGSKTSTVGGTTPDGSGTAPRFDNSTGAFVTLADDAAANNVEEDKQKYLNYLGGAAVPFKSGNNSPNGVAAKKLDNLGFNTVNEDSVKNGDCAVPSTAYGYQYESKYKLSTGSAAVYCLCDPYDLCGCDDHHTNTSFVPAMLSYIGMGTEAQNISKACTISLDGATTILVDGGLSNGSTKADPNAGSVLTRRPRSKSGKCGSGTGAAASLSANGWLVGAVALGMASLIWL